MTTMTAEEYLEHQQLGGCLTEEGKQYVEMRDALHAVELAKKQIWHPTDDQIARLENLVGLVEDEWGEYEDYICQELIENVKKLREQ